MSSLGQSATTILALFLAAVLVVGVPLMTLTDRVDNVTQENVKLIVNEFVTEITNTGKLSRTAYQNFENRLAATGNTYDVEIEIHHLDENPGKKTAQANYTKIGENVYYIEYTTQVLKHIGIKVDNESPDNEDTMLLKKGDMVYVSVKNENSTAAQTLKSSLFNYSNSDEYVIFASAPGMVTVNGTKD